MLADIEMVSESRIQAMTPGKFRISYVAEMGDKIAKLFFISLHSSIVVK